MNESVLAIRRLRPSMAASHAFFEAYALLAGSQTNPLTAELRQITYCSFAAAARMTPARSAERQFRGPTVVPSVTRW